MATPTSPQAQSPQEMEISVGELWDAVRRGWLLIVLGLVIGAVLAFSASIAIPDTYKAVAVVKEASGDDSSTALIDPFGGLVAIAGLDTRQAGKRGNPALTIVKSRTFSEEFITRHDLMPVLYPDNPSPPPLWQAAIAFSKNFELKASAFVPGTLEMTAEWTDAETAAKWAMDLVTLVNELARERDIENAERSLEFVNRKLAETNIVELRRVLINLMESEMKTLMLASAREEYAFEMIDPAVVPVSPAFPNRRQMLIIGTGAGGMLAFMFIALGALFRNRRKFEIQ